MSERDRESVCTLVRASPFYPALLWSRETKVFGWRGGHGLFFSTLMGIFSTDSCWHGGWIEKVFNIFLTSTERAVVVVEPLSVHENEQ